MSSVPVPEARGNVVRQAADQEALEMAVEAMLKSLDANGELTRDGLLAPFLEALTPREHWRVGTEAEKFGVFTDTCAPIPYAGERGVLAVLQRLARDHGWQAAGEYQGGEVIALTRDGASITLEPGAQLELSGAPFRTIHETDAELRRHMQELSAISEELGITWLGIGFHPLARQDQLPWVPKLRYRVMREYLPTRGSGGLDMMRRTCTVQANFDYASEADAVEKLRIALALSPVITAMFANSPFIEGRVSGKLSERADTWIRMDPDRSGLLPFVFEDGMGFDRYVEWALDVPMFMIKRGSETFENAGQTFRSFMRDGFRGVRATEADWVSHLATLFPEVRLKKTLEVRGADSQATPLAVALPALWKGLLYDDTARARAAELASRMPLDDLTGARPVIAQRGLAASLAGRPVADWACDALEIASAGLTRLSALDAAGRDETRFLAPLQNLVEHGQTPAEALLAALPTEPTPSEIVSATALH